MTLPFDLPPWVLWILAGLVGGAILGLIGGARWVRRRPVPSGDLDFQPLPGGGLVAPGRPTRSPTLAPPAPLASAPASGVEQRTEFRRPGNAVLVLIADADDLRQPWNAWVVDRSRRGLRLSVERPLVIGQTYTVRPAEAPPGTPWTAVEVRHCSPIDGHFEAGCRFVHPPPVAVLLLYG